MAWLAFLRALVGLALTIAEIVRDRKLIEKGQADALIKSLELSHDVVNRTNKARDAAISDFDANGLPINDPNRRD